MLHRTICLIAIACSTLDLTAQTQKKTQNATGQVAPKQQIQTQVAPRQQNSTVVAPQVKLPVVGVQEQNKVVVRRVFDDLFTRGRYEFIEQIYTKDCIVHFNNRTNPLGETVAEGKGWRSAAPDLVMTADNMVVNGDIVTVDWTARGTNTGRGNGLMATRKPILIRGNSRFRLVNGKIAEVWNNYDRDEILRQAGVPKKIGQLYFMTQDCLWALNKVASDQEANIASLAASISSFVSKNSFFNK